MFILIETQGASAGISPSETVLIFPEKIIIVIETPLTPYIVFIVIWLIEASPYKMQHILL